MGKAPTLHGSRPSLPTNTHEINKFHNGTKERNFKLIKFQNYLMGSRGIRSQDSEPEKKSNHKKGAKIREKATKNKNKIEIFLTRKYKLPLGTYKIKAFQ